MSDRRRNLVILAFVLLLLAGAIAVIVSKPVKQGLDLKGGVSLVYEAKPTRSAQVDNDSIQRTIDIMNERVNALGVSEPEIQRSGENQIEVSLPDVQDTQQAQDQVGTTAQLYFYDWEANIVGPDGKPAPDDDAVTGGSQAGQPGAASLTYYEAVTRAAGFDPRPRSSNTHDGLWYGIDKKAEKVLCGPQESKADVQDICKNAGVKPTDYVEVPRGYIVVQAEFDENDEAAARAAKDAYFVLRDEPALSGAKDIRDPKQDFDSQVRGGGPIVTFSFSDDGKDKWQDVTRAIAQRGSARLGLGVDSRTVAGHFAIVLDNRLISVPIIDPAENPDGIDGTNGSQISGTFTIEEAQRLANLIKTGALPLRLELISESQVSATLGQQALRQGITAGLVGFGLVALFLIVFYRVLGVIAVGALFIYSIYFYALVKLIPVTLTLPGIAGLILTLGVAADANIVIFERVKEEVRAGRSGGAAIAAGYRKGLSTIIDANVVTVMVAFILFVIATAGVKGFALTLGLGTITSLFTAVLATQAVLGTMQRTKLIQRPSALGARPEKTDSRISRFDFTGASKWMFSISGVILIIGALAIGGKGIQLGIDFESGTRAKVAFEGGKQPSTTDVAEALRKAGFENPKVQTVTGDKELGGEGIQVSLAQTGTAVAGLRQTLTDEFGDAKAIQIESIGPTFGATVARGAIIAIIASLLVISAYIALRFEWKFAVPVLIALVHDLLITAGVYALVGREVTTATVAALLTILGYSLYDTIIVFDRIRENAPRMPRAAFSQVVNRSMSEVVVRSLVTSLSTGMPILALLLFGGETLQDFAFALFIGVLSGAYSSIFIATPVLVHWKERESQYRNRRRRIAAEHGGVVPAYATGSQGVLLPDERDAPAKRRQRLTSPDDPERSVSQDEFAAMVADIADTATEAPARGADDATPEDLVMKDEPRKPPKPKRPGGRNKRHGRPR
ncbi:MAG: protein translocase subunit SecD [Baekduia sp.]